MRIEVHIEHHERYDAVVAYAKHLSPSQANEVLHNHYDRLKLDIDVTGGHTIIWYWHNNEWQMP